MNYTDVKRIRQNPKAEDVDNRELSELIDEAIEKQIPKKPNSPHKYMPYNRYCPRCNALIGRKSSTNKGDGRLNNKYCAECGQAIKWGDEANGKMDTMRR